MLQEEAVSSELGEQRAPLKAFLAGKDVFDFSPDRHWASQTLRRIVADHRALRRGPSHPYGEPWAVTDWFEWKTSCLTIALTDRRFIQTDPIILFFLFFIQSSSLLCFVGRGMQKHYVCCDSVVPFMLLRIGNIGCRFWFPSVMKLHHTCLVTPKPKLWQLRVIYVEWAALDLTSNILCYVTDFKLFLK